MNMPRRTALAAGFGALAAAAAGVPAAAQTETKITVLNVPVDVSAMPYYALDKGFFQKRGLSVEIAAMGNTAQIISALVSGSAQFGAGSTTGVAQARERGIVIDMVAPAGIYTSAVRSHGLIVRADSPIHSAHDLVGKTVAIAGLKSIAEVALDAYLDKNGVEPSSVKTIELAYGVMIPGVAAGRIDAASIEAPFLDEALAQGMRSIANVYDAIAPQWVVGAFYATDDYVKAHPDIVKKYAAAIDEAADWGNRNPVEAWKILDKYAKTTTPPDRQHVRYTDRLRASDIQPLIDASAKYGLLKASVPAKDLFAPGIGD